MAIPQRPAKCNLQPIGSHPRIINRRRPPTSDGRESATTYTSETEIRPISNKPTSNNRINNRPTSPLSASHRSTRGRHALSAFIEAEVGDPMHLTCSGRHASCNPCMSLPKAQTVVELLLNFQCSLSISNGCEINRFGIPFGMELIGRKFCRSGLCHSLPFARLQRSLSFAASRLAIPSPTSEHEAVPPMSYVRCFPSLRWSATLSSMRRPTATRSSSLFFRPR